MAQWFTLLSLFMFSWTAGLSASPSGTNWRKNHLQCKEDFNWYKTLPNWIKAAYIIWWCTRKMVCIINTYL